MGTTEDVSGLHRAEQAEIVHESAHVRITRRLVAGRSVIGKEPLGPDAEARLRHEVVMLERLRRVPGVAQLVEVQGPSRSIMLADAGDTTLAGLAKRFGVDELVRLAESLARAVAEMHRRGVMHRDINPGNVVLASDGSACLVDFALAASMPELRPSFTHHSQIVGTLAYLAPESTGRTGRPVDQRADLYALGATLYEAATGQAPFGSGDPLRLVHDHLARVPVAPAEINPSIPAALSQIILHLLEKEPDSRYQSADGLLFDLERLRVADAPASEGLGVGVHDLALRLLPPSRLVGREAEVAALEAAYEEALAGRCRIVLVGGAAGVGKTALVDQLRPVVTGTDGWFVAGKFDQYRRDLEFDGVAQAFRALGRLLLAEPEDELAAVRGRLLRALGPNAGLATAVIPEFATLLAAPPDAGDPLTAQVRAQRNAVQILRAVATRQRPVVFFVDDLQWAGRTPLGLFDLVAGEQPIEGLLLVGAYRDGDLDAADPLAGLLSRWRQQAGVRQLGLDNLPAPALAGLFVEMLHVPARTAGELAGMIAPHTSGNPYETVELLDGLRRTGALAMTAEGWRWDAAAVRAHLGEAEASALSWNRIGALPPRSRAVVEAMACLGGRAEADLLRTATGEPAEAVEQAVAPALDEGLLVAEPGTQRAVRFRHDRLREAVLTELDPQRRHDLQLGMARRLASVPELFAVAAEQYRPVADAVDDPAEREQVVALLRRAADQAKLTGDHARVRELLAAVVRLADDGDTATLAEVHTGRHAALYSLGLLEQADVEYLTIEGLSCTAVERAEATAVQVRSLTYRNLPAEAVDLAVKSLRELGIAVPFPDQFPTEVRGQFDYLYRWLNETDATWDATRPELTDPALLAAAALLNAAGPAAYYAADHAAFGWFTLEALRIWLEHGLCPALVAVAGHAAYAAVALRDDYAAGCRALRRILAAGEARGYEPATSQARSVFALYCWWSEPLENGVQEAQRAREALLAGGALANAAYGYRTTVSYLLDCAPALGTFVAEVEAGLAFVRRTGNQHLGQSLDSYRWLADVLRGANPAAEEAVPDRYGNPLARVDAYLAQEVAAAIFGDQDGLARHTAAAIPLLYDTAGFYPVAMTRLLRGLALAAQVRTADGDQRGAFLAELDDVTQWLADRAADAPENFLHLQRLLEAERAWALGDFHAAALAFDAARREVAGRQRPWHRALITERAARFYLAHGVDQVGHDLLAQAREQYDAWGATAKVAQLDWAYPTLHPASESSADPTAPPSHQRAMVTTGTLDLLGILSASQALSSETSLDRLHARVVEVLGALTGATAVNLLLWDEGRRDWLPRQVGSAGLGMPLSALRYVARTGDPLVVADAMADDRFARDPYLAGADCCALLAVPITRGGTLRAVLLLENRLLRGAFTADRLDAVTLVAGQLAVSLDNAHLYEQLATSRTRIVAAADQARRRIERDLHDGAQQRLVTLALQLRGVQAEVPPEADELRARLEELAGDAKSALDELREIARGLHPAALARGGLPGALPALSRRCPLPVRLNLRLDERLPDPIELAAYYAVAEALTNAAKHGRASVVHVDVATGEDELRITVRDDGCGGADLAHGTGLLGLNDRIEAVAGRLTVHSPPGAGTTVQITLPLDHPSRSRPSG
jgi:signal transduction histidine kinase